MIVSVSDLNLAKIFPIMTSTYKVCLLTMELRGISGSRIKPRRPPYPPYHGWIERADLCPLQPRNLGLHNSAGEPEAHRGGRCQEITLALIPTAVGRNTEEVLYRHFVNCP